MNNIPVSKVINECEDDLLQVHNAINVIGLTSTLVPYLTKYALIKACGTIEVAYKTIVADYCISRSNAQVKNYINKRVRETSSNPTYDNICYLLKEFDNSWNITFKSQINALGNKDEVFTSLKSLVESRNDFAHGGNPTITIDDILKYFNTSKVVIETMDKIVI